MHMNKSSWTSIRGLISSAQRFPRVLWHVRMPFVAMALPWWRTADMLTCKVAAVAIYTRAAQSALSLYLTLLVFSLFLISFLSFSLINYQSLPQTIPFSDPPPFSLPLPPPGSPIQVAGACEPGRASVYTVKAGVRAALCLWPYITLQGVSQSHRHLARIFPSRGATQPKYSL